MSLLISHWQMSYIMRFHDVFCLCEGSSLFDSLEIGRHDLLERCTQWNIRSYDSNSISFCEYSLALPLLIDYNNRTNMLDIEDVNRLFDRDISRSCYYIFNQHTVNLQLIISSTTCQTEVLNLVVGLDYIVRAIPFNISLVETQVRILDTHCSRVH